MTEIFHNIMNGSNSVYIHDSSFVIRMTKGWFTRSWKYTVQKRQSHSLMCSKWWWWWWWWSRYWEKIVDNSIKTCRKKESSSDVWWWCFRNWNRSYHSTTGTKKKFLKFCEKTFQLTDGFHHHHYRHHYHSQQTNKKIMTIHSVNVLIKFSFVHSIDFLSLSLSLFHSIRNNQISNLHKFNFVSMENKIWPIFFLVRSIQNQGHPLTHPSIEKGHRFMVIITFKLN